VVAASGGNHGAAVAYVAQKLGIKSHIFVPELSGKTKIDLIKRINEILSVRTKKLIDEDNNIKKIILFVGVNGSGKTTTLGKIANKLLLNKKVLIAACDTFRAAAVDQLEDWAKKSPKY